MIKRRFPTAESRVALLCGSKYYNIPQDAEIFQLFQSEIRLKEQFKGNQNITSIKNNTIWPFVYIKRVRLIVLFFYDL